MSGADELDAKDQVQIAKINELGIEISELVRTQQKKLKPAECLMALTIVVSHICQSASMSHDSATELIRDMLRHVVVSPKRRAKRASDA